MLSTGSLSADGVTEDGLLLGVDGGGTRTDCLITTCNGMVIGKGSSGPSNPQAVGYDSAVEEIRKCILMAMRSAGITFGSARVASACFGLAGVGRKRDCDLIDGKLRVLLEQMNAPDLPSPVLALVNDGVIALAGANSGEPGVIVIAGTGSLAYGVSPDGHEARAGGWGYILGDEGSAYDIGRKGLGEALRAADGRQTRTCLTDDLSSAIGVDSIDGVIPKVYEEMSRPEMAALAPIVGQAARRGDQVARSIILDAGRELGLMAVAVIRRLRMVDYAGSISVAGGVLESNEMVRDAMHVAVQEFAPKWSIAQGQFPPVVGAIFIARRGLKDGSIDTIIQNIVNTATASNCIGE